MLTEFAGLVEELGGSPQLALEGAGLSRQQIEQPALLIPLEKEARLLDLAARQCDCPSFGLELAARQNLAVFGPLSLLILDTDTLKQGLEAVEQHLHSSAQGIDVTISERDGLCFLDITTDNAGAAACEQMWVHAIGLSSLLVRMLAGPDWTPRSAFLPVSEPRKPGLHSRYLRCPVAFDSGRCTLVFDAATLDLPRHESVRELPAALQEYLSQHHQGDFLSQIRQVIQSLLSTGDCSAETVAACMGYSLRTLQRKLGQERTTFQRQVDRVRADLAVSYLREPQFSLTDITEFLGFAEPSVFSRGFKRWFGESPSSWRERTISQDGII